MSQIRGHRHLPCDRTKTKWGIAGQPKRIIDLSDIDSYLIYHTYNLNKPGTFMSNTSRMLSLYNKKNGGLRNQITIKYPINDYAYDTKGQSIILSTGEYDGGCFFEGELLKWKLNSNEIIKLISDNREFRKLKLINDTIKVDVMHTDDYSMDKNIKQYSFLNGDICHELIDLDYKIVERTSEDNFYLSTSRNIEAVTKQFNKICKSYDATFHHKYSANCIKITNYSKLIVGFNHSKISIIQLDKPTEKEIEIEIEEDAHCYQIIPFKDNKWILNFMSNWPLINHTYVIDKKEELKEIPNISGLIYTNDNGKYMTKQIVPYCEEEEGHLEFLLDKNLQQQKGFRIGNYNAYQHHLELSTSTSFYFFQGIDNEKFIKKLVKYSIEEHKISDILTFNEDLKIVYPNAVKIDEIIYFSCTIYPSSSVSKLLSLNIHNKETKWLSDFPAPVLYLRVFDKNTLLFLDIKGNVGKVELTKGQVTLFNEQLKCKNQQPICFDFKEDLMAIGYGSGTVEILKIVKL